MAIQVSDSQRAHQEPPSTRRARPAAAPSALSGQRRLAFDLAAIGMGVIATDGRWLSVNSSLCAMLGRTQDELLCMTLDAITHPVDAERDASDFGRLLRRECDSVETERRLVHRTGADVWVLQRLSVSCDNADRPIHFIWQAQDITENKRAREAQGAAEHRLQAVVDNAPIVLFSLDAHGVFTLSEGRGLAAMGFEPGELCGRSAFEVFGDVRMIDPTGAGSSAPDVFRRVLAGAPCACVSEIGEMRFDTKLTPIHAASGEVVGLIGVATDVTERVRAESALAESEASFHTLIDQAPEMILVHRHGRVLYANASAVAALGCASSAELLGHSVTTLVHPDDQAVFATRVSSMVSTGEPAAPREFRMVRKNGPPLMTELIGVPVVFRGEPAIVSIARDVTARKLMQMQLLQTDRLVSLGTLAAGVAHEINNPLTYVLSNIELVSRSLRARADECRARPVVDGPALADTLDQLTTALRVSRDGAQRVHAIVRDLTTFARTRDDRRALLDVRSILEPAVNIVWNEIRHRAKFTRDFRDVPLVEAHEGLLGQVFVNLLINAAQAIPEGQADAHEIRVSTYTDEAGRAVIEVRDTGEGIPRDVIDRIFDPFFTTKPVGAGTGLGLSIVHGAVSSLGGEITVETALGQGSLFRVAFPAAGLRRSGSWKAVSGGPSLVRGRVLIIDDEPLVVESLKRALSEHDVRATTRTREALGSLLTGERFDVILCDLMMPVMSGMDFYAELAREAPEQAARVVFMTAGAFTPRARAFLEEVLNPRLEKPVDLDALKVLIQERVRARVSARGTAGSTPEAPSVR